MSVRNGRGSRVSSQDFGVITLCEDDKDFGVGNGRGCSVNGDIGFGRGDCRLCS